MGACFSTIGLSLRRLCFLRWSSKKGPSIIDSNNNHSQQSTISEAGNDFGTGKLRFKDIAIAEIATFETVWSTHEGGLGNKGVSFCRPVNIPEGFQCLGFFCRPNQTTSDGRILVVQGFDDFDSEPPLQNPTDYTLVWSHTESNAKFSGPGFFWLPMAPDGYRALGYVVTTTAQKPDAGEVTCVRADLTDACKANDLIWDTSSPSSFHVWSLTATLIGAEGKGFPVGSFYGSVDPDGSNGPLPVACLKNSSFSISGMPSLVQLKEIVSKHGPTFFFHPDERYFPSSISWLLSKGILLQSKEGTQVVVSSDGSNLPAGGLNDDDYYWIDFPRDAKNDIKLGNLSSAELYIHAKPMLGATFTDIAMWIYHPFNGPATAKVELIDVKLGKIGEHVSDWEHITMRVNNFTGKLEKVFFAQHSGGEWVDAADLEYVAGEKFAVYSAKSSHASYAHAGLVLQGGHGVGIRNDTAKGGHFLDSSRSYWFISAGYLADAPEEPAWLQYMGKWGPKVEYDTEEEAEDVIHRLPAALRSKAMSLLHRLPNEIFGEEGPTGPKAKSSWLGDEKM